MPTNSPYCAAKGGVRMLMRTIAVELAPHGITVNNIAPGAIETPINKNLDEHPEQRQQLLEEIPFGKIGQPGMSPPWPSTWPRTPPPTPQEARSSSTAA